MAGSWQPSPPICLSPSTSQTPPATLSQIFSLVLHPCYLELRALERLQYFLQILTLPFSRLEAFKHPLYILGAQSSVLKWLSLQFGLKSKLNFTGGLPSSKLAHQRQPTWPQRLTLTEGIAGLWPRIYSQSGYFPVWHFFNLQLCRPAPTGKPFPHIFSPSVEPCGTLGQEERPSSQGVRRSNH